ncbi:hypothetical protein DPMN_162143 [Dreissena polymorpha]|uniref:Uncharacterized protein n=1 Tax=Dreissena polymorpha TaxID=45954 RepID=A0A9D4IQA4_DREPO|nr:hypothetical protein DPMN_162143 [Dreissena polymorpha]
MLSEVFDSAMGVGIGSLLHEEQEAVRTTFQAKNEGARRMGTRRIPYGVIRSKRAAEMAMLTDKQIQTFLRKETY